VCFADGREPKFVLGIVLLDEVVSELVGEGEEPRYLGLLRITFLNVLVVPCFEVPQVKKDASVPIECNRSSSNVIENM